MCRYKEIDFWLSLLNRRKFEKEFLISHNLKSERKVGKFWGKNQNNAICTSTHGKTFSPYEVYDIQTCSPLVQIEITHRNSQKYLSWLHDDVAIIIIIVVCASHWQCYKITIFIKHIIMVFFRNTKVNNDRFQFWG